jgi:hypothetical protein
MKYYFVRANGDTGHNNPNAPEAYVPGEKPVFPETSFNYYSYCLRNNFVRIGWPGAGDIKAGNRHGALDSLYASKPLNSMHMGYLTEFACIDLGSIILMPNKDKPGDLYIGEVNSPYYYHHDIPKAPYECAHRLGVKWDTDKNGKPIVYNAKKLGISIDGGLWRKAFGRIDGSDVIKLIDNQRQAMKH